MSNTCITGKRVYVSESLAVEALIEAHIQFEHRAGNGPITIYRCEDCGNYHLTSSGNRHPRLEEAMRDGSLTRQKTARHWQQKLK